MSNDIDLERAAQVCEEYAALLNKGCSETKDLQEVVARQCAARIRALAAAQPEGWKFTVTELPEDARRVLYTNLWELYDGEIPKHLGESDLAPSTQERAGETSTADGNGGQKIMPSDSHESPADGRCQSAVLDTPPEELERFGLGGAYVLLTSYRTLHQSATRLQAELAEARHKIEQLRYISNVNGDWSMKFSNMQDRAESAERELAGARTQHELASKNAHMHYENSVKWKASAESAERRVGELTAFLRRMRQWDMLDTSADGSYWKHEIDAALREPS